MKTALWIALAPLLAAVLWWLAPVDFAGAGEQDFSCVLWVGDEVSPEADREASGLVDSSPKNGRIPGRGRGNSLSDIVHDSEGGQMPSQEEFNRRGAGDAETEVHVRGHSVPQPPEPSQTEPEVAPPSVKGGERPSEESPTPLNTPAPHVEGQDGSTDSGTDRHGESVAPPRAPDAGGPGRVLAPPTAWLVAR